VTFVVNDGSTDSKAATSTVSVRGVNSGVTTLGEERGRLRLRHAGLADHRAAMFPVALSYSPLGPGCHLRTSENECVWRRR
jgi:hypothetical protein